MTAIHLRASGLERGLDAELLEDALVRLAGVARVALVKSVGLVSVMYDETRSSAEQIIAAIRAFGFEVREYPR